MDIKKHTTRISSVDRIIELDGLRGIAILMVLIWHYIMCVPRPLPQTDMEKTITLIGSSFWSGVDLFFVLSGFLITSIILENYREKNFLKVFWIKRSYRILPVLFLLVGTCYLIKPFCRDPSFDWLFSNLMPWWSYLTFTQNFFMGHKETTGGSFLGITWSLAIEEQFYITLPIIVLILGKSKFIKMLVPLILTAFVLRLYWPGYHNFVVMPFRMDSLLAGSFVSVLWNNNTIWTLLTKIKESILILLFLGLCVTWQLLINDEMGVFHFIWFAFLYSLLLMTILLYQKEKITSIFRSSSLCFLGAISYGLYMYHQAINGLLHGYINGGAPSLKTQLGISITVISLGLSILISWLSHRYFESYFIKRSKKWSYNSPARIQK